MDTERMGQFPAQVSAAHPEEFRLMVIDGASSHVAKALVVPENIRLYRSATVCAGTQSAGTPRGRTPRKGVSQPCLWGQGRSVPTA